MILVHLLVIDLASFGFILQNLGVSSSGLVAEDSFVKGAGAVALDPGDRFVLDTAQNKLFFDIDGSGSASPVRHQCMIWPSNHGRP